MDSFSSDSLGRAQSTAANLHVRQGLTELFRRLLPVCYQTIQRILCKKLHFLRAYVNQNQLFIYHLFNILSLLSIHVCVPTVMYCVLMTVTVL